VNFSQRHAGGVRHVRVPSSKPETQRALLIGSLAAGTSRVYNDLRCEETDTMAAACESIGARIRRRDGYAEVTGTGAPLRVHGPLVQAEGSALIFRTFAALASVTAGPTIVTGDATLRNRPMLPLFSSLRDWGARIVPIAEDGHAPIVVTSDVLEGGVTSVPGNVSSQFVSSLLLVAPLARRPCTVHVTDEILSRSYILQTVSAMRHAGIAVRHTDDLRTFEVEPGAYQPVDSTIRADYTSASYVLAAMALFPGTYVIDDIAEQSLQGERAIVEIVRRLGLQLTFHQAARTLTVVNGGHDVLRGDFRFAAEDYPNIIPTLATLGAFVDGTFTVTGGSLTRLHKSPRILAMVTELRKLGVDIDPIYEGEVIDGFVVRGDGPVPDGGAELSSWGDHRIFMSLYIAGLKCRRANALPGAESVALSFPGFFDALDAVATREAMAPAS